MTHYDLLGMAIGALFVAGVAGYLAWVLTHPDRF
jgi:hypothetical protein